MAGNGPALHPIGPNSDSVRDLGHTPPVPTWKVAMIGTPSKLLGYGLSLALSASSIHAAGACTRVLYAGDDGLIIAGRSMDWNYDTRTNLWVFPRGMQRDGRRCEFGEMDFEIRQPDRLGL